MFHQEMVKRGILMGTQIIITWAHKSEHIGKTVSAMKESLKIVGEANKSNAVDRYLEGKRSTQIFKKDVLVGVKK